MKLIAHRGASLERPENSLESLEYGSELGAFAVECDVRMTADGVYIIFHDDRLERLGGDRVLLTGSHLMSCARYCPRAASAF